MLYVAAGGVSSINLPLRSIAPIDGFTLPAGKLVPLTLYPPLPGGRADRQCADFHWRGLRRALEQAPALRRAIRPQIGVARFVANGRDHVGAAGSLCRGFCSAAFETAVEAESRSRFGKFVAAAAVWHYRVFPA